jgi:hypothetical protein
VAKEAADAALDGLAPRLAKEVAGRAAGFGALVTVLPVLALESRVYREYRIPKDRLGRGFPGMAGTEREARERGWRLHYQGTEVRPVFVHHEGAGSTWLEGADDAIPGSAWELVAAPWHPDEDLKRLAAVVTRIAGGAAYRLWQSMGREAKEREEEEEWEKRRREQTAGDSGRDDGTTPPTFRPTGGAKAPDKRRPT